MRFFDAHCDTVMRADGADFDFVGGDRRGHLDLPRLLTAGHRVQLFAVFAPRSYYPGRDVRAYAEQALATLHRWADTSAGRMRIALTGADIRASVTSSDAPIAALLGLEGADPLEGQAENLIHFHRLGVRSIIPAWDDNPFSGTSMGAGGPLTAEGIRLLELAETLGVMVDVSHLSDSAFEQVAQLATRPFVASHSNCRALAPAPRNLTDAQIRALADRGGVMGINLAPDFLAPDYLQAWDAVMMPARAASKAESDAAARQRIRAEAGEKLRAIPLPGIEWIGRHVRHAIAVGGEECIGLGGDLDGITFMPAGVTGAESYPAIAESLQSLAGLTPRQVEKVCWGNMARVFGEVLS